MKKIKRYAYLLFLFLLLLPLLTTAQVVDFRIPYPRRALKEIAKTPLAAFKDIRSIQLRSYTTDTAGNLLEEDKEHQNILHCTFPRISSYRIKNATQDTLTRIEYELYTGDTLAIRYVKGFQLGETSFLFYAKNGTVTPKENYFNGGLSSVFRYQYDAAENLIRWDKAFSEFENSTEYTLYTYDEHNLLLSKREYVKGALVNDLVYTPDEEDIRRAKTAQQHSARDRFSARAQFIKDNTFYEYDEKGNWIKVTFKNDDGRHYISERTIVYQ